MRAQYELAELVRLPASSPPPLPADAPLVVPYDTKFNQMFASRTPPDGARLSDKTLPIQHQAIEDRAAAVQAADDALAAVIENYQNGRGDAAAVVACSRELLRQQRAFIETVCAYNRNIADYALLVVAADHDSAGIGGDSHRSAGEGGRPSGSTGRAAGRRATSRRRRPDEPRADDPVRRSLGR